MKRGAFMTGALPLMVLTSGIALQAASTGGLRLDAAGSITSNPAEVVTGARSIKGSYTGTGQFTNFLRGDSTTLALRPNQSYRVTFRYKILVTPDKGFNAFFVTGKGYQQGIAPVNSFFVQAAAGTTGQASFTERLQDFDDYTVVWTVIGKGAIAVDDIQIVNVTTGEPVVSEDAEVGTALLSSFFVSASKTVFTWGEPVKVSATLYDENGTRISTSGATWTVDFPERATVAADGTVTPKAMQTFVVRGRLNGNTGEVRMQAVPRRIAVVPETAAMIIGTSQRMRAEVMDVNDRPIPGIGVFWTVTSQYLNNTRSATIDQTGMLKGLALARVRVLANINYPSSLPGFIPIAQGEILVDIKLAPTYQFERVFVAKASGAATSTLAPRSAQLIPTETGGFMFAASLDGLGSTLLEWNDGNVQPLLPSGRVSAQSGFPLADLLNYTRSSSGEVLTQEADTATARLLSRGPAAGPILPLAGDGSPVFGASSTSRFEISRRSLADSGAMVVSVGYVDAITGQGAQGLFRAMDGGSTEPVITTIDDRLDPADVPKTFFFYGIANDGTVWFQSWPQGVVWRCRPGKNPEKMISTGDVINGETVRSVAANYSGPPNLFVASNGDAIAAISTEKGSRYLLYHDGDSAPAASLASAANSLYWYDPQVGALIDTNVSPSPRGLYLWNKDGAKLLLALNSTSLDGSPVQEILSATCTSNGNIYVMVSTANNPMVIARLSPNPAVLLQSGDPMPVSIPPVISALIPGKRSGMPLVLAGGLTGSIAQIDDSGDVSPIVKVGAKLPDGKYFAGSQSSQVRTLPDGRIFFAPNTFLGDTAIYSWNNGAIDVALRGPLTTAAGAKIGFPGSFEVNRRGDFAVRMTWAGFGTFFVRDGRATPLVTSDALFEGVDGWTFNSFALDEAGNVLFGGNAADGTGPYYGVWDGASAHLVMTPETKMPDGRAVTRSNNIKGCEDGFLLPMFGTYVRYRNGWDYLTLQNELKANGSPANDLDTYNYDANRPCDVAFLSSFSRDLEARAGSRFKQIQDLNQLTSEGDLLRIVQVLINDDATVYVLGANDRGEEVIYRATPLP